MMRLSRQIAFAGLSIWVVATLCFISVHCLPGDSARLILGPQASSTTLANFRRAAGLDKPLAVQYLVFLERLAHLDFGLSHALRRPVTDLLRERGKVSALLACAALGVAAITGLSVPLVCRWRRLPRLLAAARLLASAVAFLPPQIMALATLFLFAGLLGWMPVIFDTSSFFGWITAATVLAAYPTALVMQLFDTRLAAESSATYCTRARAAGFSEGHVIWREAARNALPAALAALTNGLAFFVTGAFFVEAIFGLPGLGRLTQDAIRNQDVSVLQGVCLVVSAFVVVLAMGLRAAQTVLNPHLCYHNA